ncbi:MAG: hypothetical protein CMJ81_06585 [Planctomycetaceae bacterium]|nr:hypothetical protein [Planctomycetaceae bacterium]MBP63109.1 hypothetical protein [Planctomycetaceae bacterium]
MNKHFHFQLPAFQLLEEKFHLGKQFVEVLDDDCLPRNTVSNRGSVLPDVFTVQSNAQTAVPTSKNIFQHFKSPLSQRGWSLKFGRR